MRFPHDIRLPPRERMCAPICVLGASEMTGGVHTQLSLLTIVAIRAWSVLPSSPASAAWRMSTLSATTVPWRRPVYHGQAASPRHGIA